MKNAVKKLLSFLLAIATEAITIAAGTYLLPQDSPAALVASLVCVILMVILFIVNFTSFRHGNRQITSEEFLKQRETVFQASDQARLDPSILLHRMERTLWGVRIYYFLLILLAVSMIFFRSAIHDVDRNTFSHLFAAYILWGLYQMLFQTEKSELPEYPLSRDAYPELYKMVDEARDIAKVKLPIRMFLGGENVSVAVINKEIIILLGAQEASLLTRSELKQVLLHELAHVVNQDSLRLARYQKVIQRWDAKSFDLLTWYGTMLMIIPTNKLQEQCALYLIASSSTHEQDADALVKKLGDPQQLVNALGKIAMLDFFRSETCRELDFDYLNREGPSEHYNEYFLSLFYARLAVMETRWRQTLAVQLPARIDSHPIFRQRMENMNITSYVVTNQEADGAYLEDVERMCDWDDRLSFDYATSHWEEAQAEHKKRLTQIEKYRSAETPFESFSNEELYDMAGAFVGLEDETAIVILDHILSQEPKNTYALSMKGTILLRMENEEGAELLFRAAEESVNFIDEYLEPVGDYALKTGNQPLLERYREAILQLTTQNMDRNNALYDNNKQEQMVYSDLDSTVFNAVLSHIKSSDQGTLSEVMTAKKVVGQDYVYMYFLVFKDGISTEVKDEVYYSIFRYLDMSDEHFYLEVTDPKLKTYKQLKQWLPDCSIYLNT